MLHERSGLRDVRESSCCRSDPYVTSVRITDVVRLDLFEPGMFRVRLARECPYRESDESDLTPGMLRLVGDAQAHAASAQARQQAAENLVLPVRDPFDPCLDIPFCCGQVDPWPTVRLHHQHIGDRHAVMTDEIQIRVDAATGEWSVRTLDGRRQIFPSGAPRHGYFHGEYALFEREYGNRNADVFYCAEHGEYRRQIVSMQEAYFIHGPGYRPCLARFNRLVGPQPMLPKKLYGFIQTQHLANQGTQSRLLALAEKLRTHNIPCDVLIIDYEWGDGCDGDESFSWGSRTAWASTYDRPLSPVQMLQQLRALHFETMLIHHSEPQSGDVEGAPWFQALQAKIADGVAGTWQDTRRHPWQDYIIWRGLERQRPGRRPYFLGNNDLFLLDGWFRNRGRSSPCGPLLSGSTLPSLMSN